LPKVAFGPGFNGPASAERLDSAVIGINASSENADILALRKPFLYLFHHTIDWDTDVFRRLRFHRLGECSIQIYTNPSKRPSFGVLRE